MGDPFKRILDRMGEVVHWINAPLIAKMIVRDVANTVKDGIAEMDVGRSHIDLGSQTPFPVGVFTGLHIPENLKIAFDARLAPGRRLPGTFGNAAIFLPLLLCEIAAISFTRLDEILGDFIHLVEHVRRIVKATLSRITLSRPAVA